jgi:hypothetical protein
VLDVIGINAYYDIPGGGGFAAMVHAWEEHKSKARALHRQFGNKPVVYTEVGFCSGECKGQRSGSSQETQLHALRYQVRRRRECRPSSEIQFKSLSELLSASTRRLLVSGEEERMQALL